MFDFTNKTAIITGASKGIGLAIATQLGLRGANIVLSSRKQQELDDAAESLQKLGIKAIGVAANTGNSADLQHLVEQTVAHFGSIDIVVNNAAANPVFGPVEQTDNAAFDKIMQVNVRGPFELAKLCLPHLQARGGGAIINISSVGGLRPEPQLGIYSVSKAALISLSKVMAKEWGQYNIRCNVICPGLIKTKFSEALWSNDKIMQYMLKQLPIARVGTPQEIGALALFLASEEAAYCTGSVFTADGGFTI